MSADRLLIFPASQVVFSTLRAAKWFSAQSGKPMTALCLILLVLGAVSQPASALTATTTTLSVTSGGVAVTSITAYNIVTLTATVKAGSSPVSPGQVNFCDASAPHCTDVHLLGSAQLRSDGTATWRFRPGPGTHTYKATFVGTGANAASTSTTAPLKVVISGGQYPSSTLLSKSGTWGRYSLTATVEEFGSTSPLTGTISLEDTSKGNAVLATAPLGASVPSLYWATQAPCMNNLSPTSTVAADFNGDGYLDIAAVESLSQIVAIFVYQPIQGCYQQVATYPTGNSPSAIIMADFNSDGIPDIAVANAGSNTLTILLGNGDGTFTVSTVPAGLVNTALVTADFNGDGIPDLAVANEFSGSVVVLLGKGDGTFTAATTLSVSPAQSLAAGDFNRDGKIDLAVTVSGGIAIFTGNGDGTFTAGPTTTVQVPGNTDIWELTVADFNGDGKLDLAISAGVNVLPSTGQVLILLGNGDGTFSASTPSTTPDAPVQLAVADFNLDGIPDIAALDIAGNITVLAGQGDGKFVSPTYLVTSSEYSGFQGFAVGDMDGDGRPDVLYPGVYPPNNLIMYFGLTKPMQTASTAPVAIDPSEAGQHLVVASYPGDANATSGTSDPVSLWGTPPATKTVLAVTANGISTSTVSARTAVTLSATVTSGGNVLTTGQVNFCDASASYCTDQYLLGSSQLNASGSATYKFIPGPGSHSYKAVYQINGYGATSTSNNVSLTVSGGTTSLSQTTTTIAQSGSIGDYSLTATVEGSSSTAELTGSVSFFDSSYSNTSLATAALGASTPGLNWNSLSSTSFTNAGWLKPVAGDFNGDSILDLAVVNTNSNTITILLGNGDGTFKTISGPTLTTYPAALIAGDFNGDGKLDLAVSSTGPNYNSPGTLTIYLGNGDGTFTGGSTTTGMGSVFAAADFNGDGKLDLLINQGSTSTVVLLGNGDGTFSVATTVGSFNTLATADLNGDGIPDIIVSYITTTAGVYSTITQVCLGNGDGTFRQTGSTLSVSGVEGISMIDVGDFNGDGILDLAVTGTYYSSPVIFLGSGDGTFLQVTGVTNTEINESISMVVTDINHDGKLDLVITNGNSYSYSGYVNTYNPDFVVFLGNGDGTFNAAGADTTLGSTGYAVAADFNGDGKPELAVQAAGGLVVLQPIPTETATATATCVAPTGPAPHLVAANYPGDSNYGSSSSSTVSLDVQVATPVISAVSGTYTALPSITLTDATPGATIYYQGTGSLYTNGNVQYTGPIPVYGSGSATLTVYAAETGYEKSATASASYTLNFAQTTSAPVFSLASGTYTGTQQLVLSSTTPGAAIFYTIGASSPTYSSTVYTGPISIATTEVVTALAVAPGYSSSAVTSAQYLFSGEATPLIYTVAGDGMEGYTGDGGLAPQAQISPSYGMVYDSSGDLYFSDTSNNVIRRIDATTGMISTVAGTGASGYSGDGGAATQAQLNYPEGLALDAAGNLYIADTNNSRIRQVNAKTGVISTFLGTGNFTLNGTGSSKLLYPQSIAFDGSGNLYIIDAYGVLILSATNQTVTQIISSYDVVGIAVDSAGNVFYSTYGSSLVYKIPASATASSYLAAYSKQCIAGCDYSSGSGSDGIGDGGLALNAFLEDVWSLALDSFGNLYIADTGFNVVQKVDAQTGIITAVTAPFAGVDHGDGGLSAAAGVVQPISLAIDASGNLAIAGSLPRIRKIVTYSTPPVNATATPSLSVAAGSYGSPQTVTISDSAPGASIYYTLNGTTATTASGSYFGPINIGGTATVQAIAVAPGYLPSAVVTADYTITSTPTAKISTVVGGASGSYTYCSSITQGTSVQALQAVMGQPQNVALDGSGNLYISDSYCNAVWKVAAQTGIISLYAGAGLPNNYSYTTLGDGGLATSAILRAPRGIALDSKGNLYIADAGDNLARKVNASTGIITSVAGNGYSYYAATTGNGDDGAATSATIAYPVAVVLDNADNLYISDNAYRVRKVTATTGIITTVAGKGIAGYSGDGGAATSAELEAVNALTVDNAGNLYFADYANRIREVAASTGIISTVAGNGITGYSGEGGKATQAQINVNGLVADPQGNLYFSNGNLIRFVSAADGTISTIAGSGIPGFWGDGGAATVAGLRTAIGLAFDSVGNLYIVDRGNDAVRQVAFASNPAQMALPAFTPAAGTYVGTQSVTISETTSGATIYYTTDGTTPTTSSAQYSAPITVSVAGTIKALATSGGYFNSTVATAAYTILTAQTINFAALTSPLNNGVAPITLSATATSGLPVVFSVQSGPAAVNGNVLTITGVGTVVVAANQAGNSTYGAAPQVTQTIVVNQSAPTLDSLSPAYVSAGNSAFILTVIGTEFTSSSTVYWGSTALTTTFVSATQLTANVPASEVATAGMTAITVQTVASASTSNLMEFEVDSASSSSSASPTFITLTATVASGSTATYKVTLPSAATNVSATCLNLPVGATCTYSSSAGEITIATTSATPAGTYKITVVFTETLTEIVTAGALWPILLLPLFFIRRKLAARSAWISACLGLIVLAGVAVTIGCGGGGSSSTQTQTQTKQVTSSGTVTLTVQ